MGPSGSTGQLMMHVRIRVMRSTLDMKRQIKATGYYIMLMS